MCQQTEARVHDTVVSSTVINEPPADDKGDMDQMLNYMLSQLTQNEIEIASSSSYEYLCEPETTERRTYAKMMAKRYLESKKDVQVAIEKMKDTIQFRKDIDVDGLRQTFQDPSSDYRIPLEKKLSSKAIYVRGRDKDGRSTLVFVPRLDRDHDKEWTLKQFIYTMERAIACSKAEDSSVNAVIDFSGKSTLQVPPLEIGKQILLVLRKHYAGQVNKIFILDAPMAFSLLWKVLKPLAGSTTQQKIVFGSGKSSKASVLSQCYSTDEAASWVSAKQSSSRELALDEYLYEIPFDVMFDE